MFSTQQIVNQRTRLTVVNLPFIPHPVNLTDTDDKQSLISETERKRLLTMNLPDGQVSRFRTFSKYKLLKLDGELHAIYPIKHPLGVGCYGVVKVSQNIMTGKWEACKLVSSSQYQPLEVPICDKQNLLLHTENHKLALTYEYRDWPLRTRIKGFLMPLIDAKPLLNLFYGNNKPHHPAIRYLSAGLSFIQKIQELHKEGIEHHDLSLHNILYSPLDSQIYFIDFGSAEYIKPDRHFAITCDYASIPNFITKVFMPPYPEFNQLKEKISKLNDDTRRTLPLYSNQLNAYELCAIEIKHLLQHALSRLTLKDKTYNIGLLDISDFNTMPMDLDKLRLHSEIWLTDCKGFYSMQDYLRCRKWLEGENVIVGNKVFQHPSKLGLAYHVTLMLKERHPGCYFKIKDAISGDRLKAANRLRSRPS